MRIDIFYTWNRGEITVLSVWIWGNASQCSPELLELLEQYWAGCKHRLLIARYLHHHHEGARVAPWDGVVIISGVSIWLPGLGCVEGGWGNEEARVTCERFIEEIDKHVLRIVIGIWVGKIVFLKFQICVNKSVSR